MWLKIRFEEMLRQFLFSQAFVLDVAKKGVGKKMWNHLGFPVASSLDLSGVHCSGPIRVDCSHLWISLPYYLCISCKQSSCCWSSWSQSQTSASVCSASRSSCSVLQVCNKYRLFHRKCAVRIFIHELQNFGKRTSERSERVTLPKFCIEWIKIRTKHFLCCNLFIIYIKKNELFSEVNFNFLCTTRMTYNSNGSY